MTIDEIRNGLLQKLQQVGTQAQADFWNKNNPVATGLLNLQKATPAYQQGGEKAFGKGYLYNNQGIQNYVPQIPAAQFKNPVAQTVSNFTAGLYNLPIQAGANTFAPIVNLATDLGTNIGHKVLNQGATPYQDLKSPFARLEYNALGQNNNTQQVVGNVAGAGLDILNMSSLKAGKVVAENAINNVAKNGFLEALKTGSLQGGSFMGAAGLFQGVSDNRGAKTPLEQFQKGGEEGVKGFLLGAVTGGLLSGSGHLFGKIFVRPPKVEQQLRDAQGKWTTGETPTKPKGMAQAAWDFQLKFNKEYKRNPYTPVYPDDVKQAVSFELEKKGAGMSIRDVTKDENPLSTGSTSQSQVPIQGENNKSVNVESPAQSNQPLSSEQILAKAEADMRAATENIGGISSNESVSQVGKSNVAQQPIADIASPYTIVGKDGKILSEGASLAQKPYLAEGQKLLVNGKEVKDYSLIPDTVYRGSSNPNTSEFHMGRQTKRFDTLGNEYNIETGGTFFTADPEYAKTYGKYVKEAKIQMKNPLIGPREMNGEGISNKKIKDLEYILEPLMNKNSTGQMQLDLGFKGIPIDKEGKWVHEIYDMNGADFNIADNAQVTARMKERGYDGTFISEFDSPTQKGSTSFYVIDKKQLSSPQQPVGDIKVKPQAQIKAEIAGNLKSESFSPTTSLEGQPLQVQPQSPEAVATQPLQNQSNSIINPSTSSIQPSVKNDFAAEMDANIGKPLEQRGINVRRKQTPVPLATDEATQNFARGTSGMGSDRMKSDFADYVNQRRATKVEGFIKNKEFSDLNAKGLNGLTEFQASEKTGRFADLKNFFDAKRQEVIDKTGKDFGYKKDYLPQLWANTPEQIQQAFGNRLSKSAPFEMSSVIKDYKTGIDLGLTPKYKTLGELAGWYESRANKLIADSTYFNKLAKDGMIQPSNKAPIDWVTLNPDRFPKVTVDTGEMTYSGAYKAPPELAKMINNYLYDPREAGGFAGGMSKVADYVSSVKNKTLSFGIPGTAINAHGINILARHTLFGTGGNPVSRLLKGGAMLLNQKYSQGVLESELKTAPRAVKAGLSLSTEVENNLMNDTFRKKFGAKWNTAFEKPLFDKMIPALKLSSFNNLVKDGKMSEQDAAKLVNNVYGGINWEQAGRDRNLENFLRTVILAPDWAETNLKMGGNIAKSFVKGGPVASRYRTMAATMLGTYTAMNVANKLTTGHYMYENDPGHTLEVQTGYTSDGQKRYVRPFGTALDFVRLPLDAISSISKGDLTSFSTMIRNRLSIPAGVGVGFLTDTNYRGQAIGYKGKDKYGNDMPLSQRAINIGAEAASLVGVPSFLRQLGSSATGQQGLEQGLTQGFELPMRYVGAGNSKTQKFIGDVAGVKGKDLYDLKKRFQGEAPFSDKQKAMINQGGMPALEAVMNQRIITRQSNQIKDIQQKAASGEISPEEAQKSMQNILKQPVNTPKQSNTGTNQAYAADNGVFEYNNKYSYISPSGKTTTVDINPPTKGNGIDAFVNTNWNITKAREVWNSQLPENTKDEIFKKLGVDKTDVRYDALANHNTDVSTQYLLSKSPNHEVLLHNIITGRKESISGTQFASNGVIDNLVEQGQLSKEEGKQLKALKFDKNGNKIGESTSKGKKGKKLPLRAVKKANFKIATRQSNAKTIKSGKPTVIKAPKVSFDTQFSKKGSIPQAKKYAVKFNV